MPVHRKIFSKGQGETITALSEMNSFQTVTIIILLTVSN